MSDVTNLDNLDDIDSLLDKNLDDIADLPSFDTWPKGVHKAIITWERKDIEKTVDGSKKKVPHMQLNMAFLETLELEDTSFSGKLPQVADKMNTAYDLTNEFALGALKKAVASLSPRFNGNLKETIKGTNGFEVAIVLKHRKDKNDKDRVYPQIEDMIPA